MGRYRKLVSFAALTVGLSGAASGQPAPHFRFDVEPQELKFALRSVTREAGLQLFASTEDLRGVRSPGLHADLTVDDALKQLLAGSALHAEVQGKAVFIRGRFSPASSYEAAEASANKEIVVTGTNIHGAAPVGSPLITLGRLDLDRSGYATTQEMLQTLPQNFGAGQNESTFTIGSRNGEDTNQAGGSSINLRGLGASSTLVLLNGNRVALGGLYGTFADLSLIPSSVIDHVEVLTDGSSALYGSDAVAGVVNILFRDRFEGAETRVRVGAASDYREEQISQIIGHGWATGHLTLAYEYYRHGHLAAADRDFATEDLRAFGGPDYRTDFANPGTIHTSDGRTWAIPAGQDGSKLTPADFEAGTQNLADGRASADLLPSQMRHSGYIALTQQLADRLNFTFQGLVADRTSLLRLTPLDIGTTVPTSNAFYVDPSGAGQPVTVDYDFTPDLGPISARSHVRGYNAVAGLDWSLGSWSITGRGTFGQQSETTDEINIPNYYYLNNALADGDPATAYNVFGDGSHTNPGTIAAVDGYYKEFGRYRLWSGDLKADGPLFDLPGGVAKLAIGAEYRIESYDYATVDDESYSTPTLNHDVGLPINRKIAAGYAELLLPLLGERTALPGIQKLTVSVAGRIEHYSDFGTTTNPKVGVDWLPADGITLRASYGTSFRAPGFEELRSGLGTSQYLPIPVADPRSPTGATNALFLFGNAPGIGPEKARTWTVSAEFKPHRVPGLHLNLDYFDVSYRDRIQNISADYPVFLENRAVYGSLIDDHPSASAIAGFYNDPDFVNPYGIAASDVTALVDARTRNLAREHQTGIDFDLGYQTKLSGRSIDIGVAGTWLFHVNRQIAPGSPTVDIVNTFGSPVAFRLRGHVAGTLGPIDVAGFINYVGSYTNGSVVPSEPVSDWTTVDLNLTYTMPVDRGPMAGMRFVIGATNLFNRNPPYIQNRTQTSAIGYDPGNASPIGRTVSLEVIKSW
jgi:iron complex outermembrane receptor protein